MGDSNSNTAIQDALNSERISELTRTVLDKIKQNPKQLSTILSQLEDNQQVLGQVLLALEKNPSLKQQATSSVKRSGRAVESVNRLSSREKREMAVQARRAKAAATPQKVQALIINNSRQVKPYLLPPSGIPVPRHERECCISHNLSRGLRAYYCTEATPMNRKAEQLLGFKVGGEVIVVRYDIEGRAQHLELEQMKELLDVHLTTETTESVPTSESQA